MSKLQTVVSSSHVKIVSLFLRNPPTDLAPVVQRVDNAIQRINHYPVNIVVCFVNTYPLDSVIQPLNDWGLNENRL